MNIFFAIVRWFFALVIGSIMYVFVVVAIPVSIFSSQMLDSKSASRWVTAVANNAYAMESFTEGIFKGIATSNSDANRDPVTHQVLATMSNPNTALGISARKVFTGEIMGKNLKVNADSFYDWLDGKDAKLKLRFYVGGSKIDQTTFLGEFFKTRYSALALCTTSEKRQILAQDLSVLEHSCSIGTVNQSVFYGEAMKILDSKELKTYLNTGVPYVTEAGESARQDVLTFKRFTNVGLGFTWIVLAVSTVFMLLLFTPRPVNWIMSGSIVSAVGLTLMSMGGMDSIFTKPQRLPGTETIAEAIAETLGKPIFYQGVLIFLIGITLFGFGAYIFFKKRKTTKPTLTESVAATAVVPTPEVKVETEKARESATEEKKAEPIEKAADEKPKEVTVTATEKKD